MADATDSKPLRLICEKCGGYFEAFSLNVRFCSRECTLEAEKDMLVVCQACGRRFMRRGNQQYCSDECSSGAKREVNRRQYEKVKARQAKPEEVYHRCEWCGADYVKKYPAQRYCGSDCSDAGHARYVLDRVAAIKQANKEAREQRLSPSRRQRYVNGRVREITTAMRQERLAKLDAEIAERAVKVELRVCAFCGEAYDPADAESRGDYCSDRCRRRARERAAAEKRQAAAAERSGPKWPAMVGCLWCGRQLLAVGNKKPASCPQCGHSDFEWLRRCHDCGAVVPDGSYRCPKCAEKWRRRNQDGSGFGEDEIYGVAK